MKGPEVLEKVLAGNRRFVTGKNRALGDPVNLGEMVQTQSPIAAVLSCSDARVPPHHVLDKKIGEIFVVRVAGKVPGPSVIGSLEYAVAQLKVPLLLVLGHEGCGAVKAAMEGGAEGVLGELVKEIELAVRSVLEESENHEDAFSEAVKANTRQTMRKLMERSPVISDAVRNGDLILAGAIYSLETGEVTVLPEKGRVL
ncbi:MAG: carbonic anhydrase [bacterium]|nr:carbonic anhydrase [bacterium]MDT8396213.1 carbonic anhydrase [bacterium]